MDEKYNYDTFVSKLIQQWGLTGYQMCNLENLLTSCDPQPTLEEVLCELSNMIDNNNPLTATDNIKAIKKQIKHSKNPLEIKMLNRELNEIYKEIKKNKKY